MSVLMILGLGSIGTHVLDMMTKMTRNQDVHFVLVGRNTDLLVRKSNMAMLTASQFGVYPQISFETVDLTDLDAIAEAIQKHRPNVLFNAASIQSWRIVTELPQQAYREINRAYLGPWLPMHLSLVYNIARAIRLSGWKSFFINAAFPDIVNSVLDKVGLAPDVGIGNVANVIPALRFATADFLRKSPQHVTVRCVAHHFISHYISRHGYPNPELFHYSAECDGQDVTSHIDQEKVFSAVPSQFRRLVGLEGQPMTATSAIKVIMAALHEQNERLHAPGPRGLPGGYPIHMQGKKVAVDLHNTFSLEQAIQINEKAQFLEGVSKIEKDGTVHFSPQNMQIMKDLLGYECHQLRIEESYEYAMELRQKYQAFAAAAHRAKEFVGA